MKEFEMVINCFIFGIFLNPYVLMVWIPNLIIVLFAMYVNRKPKAGKYDFLK